MDMPNVCDCDCEFQMVPQRREEAPPMPPPSGAIKICECECDCDCDCDCKCCVEGFYSTLAEDPQRLKKLDRIQFYHTPLHEAAAAGQTTLVVEIMNLMPSLGKKLNPQGLSPLHVAVISRQADAALALAKLDKQLVCIKGKGGWTPLHHAAAATATESFDELRLLAGLLAECPEAMGVLNNRKQSAVHVALESKNEKVAHLLVNWLIIMAKEYELSFKDAHGNTTLHVAARYCCSTEILELLIKLVKFNKANNYEETPLDVAIYYQNREAERLLIRAGATMLTRKKDKDEKSRRDSKPSTMVKYLQGKTANQCPEMLTRAYYFLTKELTMEMRNTILVVAVLIATTTYQGVLQPPGGVYSAEGNTTTSTATATTISRLGRQPFPMRKLGDARNGIEHPPGQMVMGTTKYSYFMPTNTLAFMSSTLVIIFVLPDRAFIMILQACMIFMCTSYLLALNFISYYNKASQILDVVCGVILAVAFWLKLGYYCVKAYYDENEWLLRRLGVMIKNNRARFIRKNVEGESKDKGEDVSLFRRMRQQYKLISKRVD